MKPKMIKRRLHFYAIKVVDADGHGQDPTAVMERLAALVPEGDWEVALSTERSQGLKCKFLRQDRSLEGIAWYDQFGNFPDVGKGVESEPLVIDGGLRNKVHFVWWDLSNEPEAMGTPRSKEGCLVWELNQSGPKVDAFCAYIQQKCGGECSVQYAPLTEEGALAKLKNLSMVKRVHTRIKDNALELPEKYRSGPAALQIAADLQGLFEIEVIVKPKKKGVLTLSSASKDSIRTLAGSGQNVDIRVCFADGVEIPLEDAPVVFVVKDVPPSREGAKSVDSTAMMGAIRDAYSRKRDEIRAFFGRNV